jgi:glycosyltransferase involved in cell wall biosynthesis
MPSPTRKPKTKSLPVISIIVPCYNEGESIAQCHSELYEIEKTLKSDYRFEYIYVDDGSSDDTAGKLQDIQKSYKDCLITLIILSRNFGKEAAMTAGLDAATGDAVIVTDADLQDPPALIPDLIKPWAEEGIDVVYAQRVSRLGETALKKATAHLFYRFINAISRVDIPRNAGDFRLLSRRAVDELLRLRETHRFMKGLFAWVGFKTKAVPYQRQPRFAGRTKWNYLSLWNLSLEGITGFSLAPLKIATFFGILISIFSFLFGLGILVRTLISGSDVPGYPSLMVMITFMGGIQLLTIGILGEYVGRIFNEVKDRPLYVIDKTITSPARTKKTKTSKN